MKIITTLVLICAFNSVFSAANDPTSLEKLMQKFEHNKTTKVTVLLDQCTIVGDKIPIKTSLFKKTVFYLNLFEVSWIQKDSENYIALNKHLSATNVLDGFGEEPYENISYGAIKLDKDNLVLEGVLHYSKQEKGNYSSYSQNYRCPINDQNIITFESV